MKKNLFSEATKAVAVAPEATNATKANENAVANTEVTNAFAKAASEFLSQETIEREMRAVVRMQKAFADAKDAAFQVEAALDNSCLGYAIDSGIGSFAANCRLEFGYYANKLAKALREAGYEVAND